MELRDSSQDKTWIRRDWVKTEACKYVSRDSITDLSKSIMISGNKAGKQKRSLAIGKTTITRGKCTSGLPTSPNYTARRRRQQYARNTSDVFTQVQHSLPRHIMHPMNFDLKIAVSHNCTCPVLCKEKFHQIWAFRNLSCSTKPLYATTMTFDVLYSSLFTTIWLEKTKRIKDSSKKGNT